MTEAMTESNLGQQSGPVSVRPAAQNEADFLVRCNQSMAMETEGKKLNAERIQNGVQSLLEDSQRGIYFIAEYEGEPAGTLMITKEWSDWRNAFFYWIQSVYVMPDYRSKKIYAAMHRYIEKLAKESGECCGIRLYVEKNNDHARSVYQHMGMGLCDYDLMEQPFE